MEFLLDRHSSAEALKTFECGIKEMDHFIHHRLAEFLVDHKNQLFVVRDMQNTVVAMFVLSEGYFFDDRNHLEACLQVVFSGKVRRSIALKPSKVFFILFSVIIILSHLYIY